MMLKVYFVVQPVVVWIVELIDLQLITVETKALKRPALSVSDEDLEIHRERLERDGERLGRISRVGRRYWRVVRAGSRHWKCQPAVKRVRRRRCELRTGGGRHIDLRRLLQETGVEWNSDRGYKML